MARIRIEAMAAREPFYVARVARLPDEGRLTDPAVKAYVEFGVLVYGWDGMGSGWYAHSVCVLNPLPTSLIHHPTSLAINLREATQELHRALRSRATGHTAGGGGTTTTGRAGAAPHLPSAREVCCCVFGGISGRDRWVD